jgi:RNA polymerase sigma factor (sigma-70 family)
MNTSPPTKPAFPCLYPASGSRCTDSCHALRLFDTCCESGLWPGHWAGRRFNAIHGPLFLKWAERDETHWGRALHARVLNRRYGAGTVTEVAVAEERVELVVIFDKEAGSPAHRFNFLAPGVAEFFRLEHPLEVRPQDEATVDDGLDVDEAPNDASVQIVIGDNKINRGKDVNNYGNTAVQGNDEDDEIAIDDMAALGKFVVAKEVEEQNTRNLEAILEKLLQIPGPAITYAAIEDGLSKAGFELDNSYDDYEWLIGAIERADKLVVDVLPSAELTTPEFESPDDEDLSELTKIEQLVKTRAVYYEFGKAPLLRPAEERRLLETVKLGQQAASMLNRRREHLDKLEQESCHRQIDVGRQAFDQLVMANTRWIAKMVLRFGISTEHLEFEDLAQEGAMGLMRAIDHFDLHANTRLTTYATWWIRQAISRAIADKDRLIRIPVHRIESLSRYLRAKQHLEQSLSGTELELAIALEMRWLSKPSFRVFASGEVAT